MRKKVTGIPALVLSMLLLVLFAFSTMAAEDGPGNEMPGGNMPGGDTSGGVPGGDMPGGDTPGGSGDMPGGSGDMPGGGGDMAGGGGDSAPGRDTSEIYIGSDSDLTADVESKLSNFTYADDNYDDSAVTFDGYTGTAVVGGGDLLYDADDIRSYIDEEGLSEETRNTTDRYLGYLGDRKVSGFIVLGAAEGNSGNMSPGNAVTNTAGTVFVENMYIQTSGAVSAAVSGRYGLATMGNSSAVSVVKDSWIIQTGPTAFTSGVAEPGSNDGLLISGHARANFSVGNSSTFYINSSVITEGWAAMSTDSASSGGLYLYSYNSDAVAEDGGYGTYADSSCNDYLYGTRLTSAEVGMILSNNGVIVTSDTNSVPEAVSTYLDDGDRSDTDIRSVVTAGRNDVQIHSPGMNGGGSGVSDSSGNEFTLSLSHTDLITTTDLETTEDYASKYSDAVADYLALVGGANILVKSTYGTVTLDDVSASSFKQWNGSDTGVLLMSALNSDSSSRYVDSGDVTTVNVDISSCGDLTGDILNLDYQRAMDISLTDSVWSGAADSWDRDEWNGYWAEHGVTANSEEDAVYWILDSGYERSGGTDTAVSLNHSVWNVTGDSEITGLTLDDTSGVRIGDGASLTVQSGAYAGTYGPGDEIGTVDTESVRSAADEQSAGVAGTGTAAAGSTGAVSADRDDTVSGRTPDTVLYIIDGVLAVGTAAGVAVLLWKRRPAGPSEGDEKP